MQNQDENCRFCKVKVDCEDYWGSDLTKSEEIDFKGR